MLTFNVWRIFTIIIIIHLEMWNKTNVNKETTNCQISPQRTDDLLKQLAMDDDTVITNMHVNFNIIVNKAGL